MDRRSTGRVTHRPDARWRDYRGNWYSRHRQGCQSAIRCAAGTLTYVDSALPRRKRDPYAKAPLPIRRSFLMIETAIRFRYGQVPGRSASRWRPAGVGVSRLVVCSSVPRSRWLGCDQTSPGKLAPHCGPGECRGCGYRWPDRCRPSSTERPLGDGHDGRPRLASFLSPKGNGSAPKCDESSGKSRALPAISRR